MCFHAMILCILYTLVNKDSPDFNTVGYYLLLRNHAAAEFLDLSFSVSVVALITRVIFVFVQRFKRSPLNI